MKVARLILATLFLLSAALVSSGAGAAGLQTYTSPAFGWSVDYPTGWAVDDAEAGAVTLTALPPEIGLVTISTYRIAPESKVTGLGPLIDFVLDFRAKGFAAEGTSYVVTSRESGSLADGTPFALISDEIGGPGGGRSELLIALSGDDLFTVVAETYATQWPGLAERFRGVLMSFRLSP